MGISKKGVCRGDSKGLLIVNTGNGKGKTTAALGLVFRALGHGLKVSVIQFIKGTWKYGELESAKHFSENLDFHVMGKGFTWKSKDIEEDKKTAINAWKFAKEVISTNKHNLVVLDELTYLVRYKMIEEGELIDFLRNKPENMHVVITGRYATEGLIDIADMVTEFKEIKHPMKAGVTAQKGIEF